MEYFQASQTPVGFIGLGNMGFSMAENLIASGHRVVACDVVEKSVLALQEKGALVMWNCMTLGLKFVGFDLFNRI